MKPTQRSVYYEHYEFGLVYRIAGLHVQQSAASAFCVQCDAPPVLAYGVIINSPALVILQLLNPDIERGRQREILT